MTTHLILMTVVSCSAAPETRPADHSEGRGLDNPFFAMDTATRDERHQTIESQLQMLKELKFAGWAMDGAAGVQDALRLADSLDLKLFAVYTGVDLDRNDPPWAPKLPEVVRTLKGRQTVICVYITSKRHRAASDAADAIAVDAVRRVATMAAESGLSVSLYPHHGFYTATVRDALRLARKTGRPNVNVTFNLCHWLRTDQGTNLEPLLREVMPHLGVVTINGADTEGDGWDRLIQPLGRGTFDVCGLLAQLLKLGYRGPIGLQGYGVKGDVHEHLSQAMKIWHVYRRRLSPNTCASGPASSACN